MSEAPPIEYAKTPDGLHIGYQVYGDGDIDIVFLPEWGAPLDASWEHPAHLRFFRFLGSLGRLIMLDYRGFGCSDPISKDRLGQIDDWAADVLAVMDSVGSEQAVICAEVSSGHAAMLFAATHPERTMRLALVNCFLHTLLPPGQDIDEIAALVEQAWGTGLIVATSAPNLVSDPVFLPFCARMERIAASPATAEAVVRAVWQRDVSDLPGRVTVPTLVSYTGDYTYASLDESRDLAAKIPGAILVEATGRSFYAPDEAERWDEWADFIVGGPTRVSVQRKLSTVLFADVVESSRHASRLGDKRWATLLDDFDGYIKGIVDRHSGCAIKQTGDGHLATFDAPGDALRAAAAIARGVPVLGVDVRVGVHVGEIEVRPNGDVGGIAVHIAARVMAQAGAGEVVVSSTVKDLVAGSGIVFADRGTHALRGVPDEWRLFTVET